MRKLIPLLVLVALFGCKEEQNLPYTKLTYQISSYQNWEYIQVDETKVETNQINLDHLYDLGKKLADKPYYKIDVCGVDVLTITKQDFVKGAYASYYIKASAINGNGINVQTTPGYKVEIERVGY